MSEMTLTATCIILFQQDLAKAPVPLVNPLHNTHCQQIQWKGYYQLST